MQRPVELRRAVVAWLWLVLAVGDAEYGVSVVSGDVKNFDD